MLNKISKIHFIGVGGIGVSAVARLMLQSGKRVSGSDATESEITKELEKEGLKFFQGADIGNITDDLDLVVYSPAVPEENLERQEARNKKIKQMSYPEFLGEFSEGKFTIAVTGTHGKSTTTALAGLLLEKAINPTVIVGSKVKTFDNKNLRVGDKKYLITEACEYRAHMMHLDPKIIVLTNIEADHLDYYINESAVVDSFQAFVDKLPPNGVLVLNSDDKNSQKINPGHKKVITYGLKGGADVFAKNIYIEDGKVFFDLYYKYDNLGKIALNIPGRHNVYNSLAAIALALDLGVEFSEIKKVLKKFKGIWRRFEKVGEKDGAIIISDYGHHPTAVRETLRAAREFYPSRRIVLAFQPHQRNRTKNLFNDFLESFDEADILILSEIYDVAGREGIYDSNISSKDLAGQMKEKKDFGGKVFYAEDLDKTKELIKENLEPNDLVIIMGAGDIYKITNF